MPEVTEPVKVDSEKVEKEEKNPQANGSTENGTSSSPEKKSPEKNEAEVLLAQGKRHLFIKDYANAVSALGSACAKLEEMYGYLADECADAYFSYGRALLELAREDSNVLGTEPEKEESEEGEEEGEEEDEKKDEEKEEKDEEGETDGKDKTESDDKTDNEGKDEETAGDETIDTTKEAIEEEDKENIENLQLSWEVFELAKKIFERQNAKDKLADTYLYLGEVQMESENYNGATDDLKRCIEVQKEILPPDHREIAETYFQLGVAYSLSNEFDLSILNFKTSHEILENRVKNLEKNGAPKEETDKNPFYSVEKEISEIKALLPEIKAKVVDMEDFKQETIRGMMMASLNARMPSADGAGQSSSSAVLAPAPTPSTNGSTSETKPVNNISHLVRKKRKPEEEAASESDTSVKKSCTDDVNK